MKLTKKQFARLIKEVTDETLNEYETITLEEYRVFFIDAKTSQPLVYKMRVEDKWSLDREIESFIQWQKEQGKELALDPAKSPQYIRRIRMNDEGEIYEGVAKNYPSRPMEEAQNVNISQDIKQFAQDIADKIKARRMKKGSADLGMDEAVRQMVEFKLAKEGWIRRGVELTDQPSADGATYNITPAQKKQENINEASKGNYTQALRKVKSLIDQSPEKKNLKALIKMYDGEPMLELRAYGLPMGDNHGAVELQDAFGSIVSSLTDDNWHVAEIDENETGGRQYKYALFTFPESGKMPGDSLEVQNAIDMGR